MTEEKVKNQGVEDQNSTFDENAYPASENSASDNVADDKQSASDTMAEDGATSQGDEQPNEEFVEPSQEEVIAVWRDKYMRLQAEFDNYRKRTLREKMDLVASGGADVIKAMLTVLENSL